MRVGVTLPQYDVDFRGGRADAGAALGYGCVAETAGFDSVWVSDHGFAVAPDGSVSGAFDAAGLSAAVAALTDRVGVGTLVLASSTRSPAQTAAIASSLRVVGGTRVTCGIGAGWNPLTHRAYGISLGDYCARAARLRDTAALVCDMYPGLRLLVGGWGDPVLSVAAHHADAWNLAWDVPAQAFHAVSARLDAACEAAGRDPTTLRRSVGLTILCGHTRRDLEDAVERVTQRAPFLAGIDLAGLDDRLVVGTPAACADRIAAYGADEVVLAPFVRDDLGLLTMIGSEVVPLLR
ncbi:MAG: LLM class flavin-dependent oxidoreductase [Acidimicrobiia bacterium]